MAEPPATRRSLRRFLDDHLRELDLRRRCYRLRRQVPDDAALAALRHAYANEWAAGTGYLRAVIDTVATSPGPILECGSGLTTVVAGTAARRAGLSFVALEHDQAWSDRVRLLLRWAGVDPSVVRVVPLTGDDRYAWYEIEADELPAGISAVLCDGPPGSTLGGRYGLLPRAGSRLAPGATILVDDIERPSEIDVVHRWHQQAGWTDAGHHVDGDKRYAVVRTPTADPSTQPR